MAGLIMKNFIINKANQKEYDGFWVNLDLEFKSHIKMAILATLASNSNAVRKSVAQCISAIASIEIPRKEWDEILPVLC